MSSAGAPSISGSLGGSVTGANDLTSDLQVTVNFGELSPANPNRVVVVVVPIAMRASGSYALNATVSGLSGGSANSLQLSDIGIGVQNLRSLGGKSSSCGVNSIITPAYNNNPSSAYSFGANGRAVFPSSLSTVGAGTALITGPQLSKNGALKPRSDNGYAIDLILAVVPQFFTPGNFTVTITLQLTSTCNNCGC